MVYIGSIPASLQRKRTITVGQQDEDHEKARDPDARSMPCSTVGAGDRLVVALFPFAAIGGGLAVGTTAGGAPLGAVAGRAAAGMPSRAEGRFGEQLDAGQAGLVVVAVSDPGATRCREPMTQPPAPAPDVLTVHGPRPYRRR